MRRLGVLGRVIGVGLITMALLAGCQSSNEKLKTSETISTPESPTQSTSELASEATEFEPVSSVDKIIWGQQIGTDKEDIGLTIAVDSTGKSCVAGYTLGGNQSGGKDVLISLYDEMGKNMWTLQTGTASSDSANGIIFDNYGDVYVTGTTAGSFSEDLGVGNIFIQKISVSGKVEWTKQYGGLTQATSSQIYQDIDDNLYICGSTQGELGGTNLGQADAYLMKLDAQGNILWTSQWGTDQYDAATGFSMDDEGNFYVIGNTGGILGSEGLGKRDLFYTQLNANGDVIKSYQFGTAFDENASKIAVDEDKNVYLTGWTNGELVAPKQGNGDAVLIKVNDTGEIVWEKQFGTSLWDGIHSVIIDKTNPTHVIVGGCSNYDQCQAFIINYDAEGQVEWNLTLMPKFSTCGREIAMDDQGNLYQTGGTHGQLFNTNDFEGTESDLFVYKICK